MTAAAVAACSFEPGSAPTDGGGDGMLTPACDAHALSCADGTTLRASCPGAEETLVPCAWGCLADAPGPRCGELVPSGGAVVSADFDPASLVDYSLMGTLDGSTGEINGMPAATLGIAYRQASNNVAVFRFKSLHVTGPLKLMGARAIALVSVSAVTIDGVIDARGPCNDGAGQVAGPGGSNGGNEGDGAGAGGGQGGDTPNRGAGGGGHGATGGSGGGGVPGGLVFGDPQITILVGGSGGGGAKTTSRGGGGGGAIQIISNTSITVSTSSGINAGGCGGLGGDGNDDAGGGGGGAGGAVLLEAPRITLAGTLAVNGGGGGNRTGGDGSAGRLDRTQASAATGGGRGGAANIFGGESGTGAGGGQTNAGGGGGVGRIRLNTATGAASELARTGATLSPDLTDGAATTTTHERANVR